MLCTVEPESRVEVVPPEVTEPVKAAVVVLDVVPVSAFTMRTRALVFA